MQSSKNITPPHKHTQLTKKKKILLWTLLPVISLGMAGVGVGVGYAIWQNKTPENPPPTPFPSSFIKINASNVTNYLIEPSTPIYVTSSININFDHQLLNLKALSDAYNGICNFIIQGTINFGFLVDPNMNCFLFGDTNSLVSISASSQNASGIVVGQTIPNPDAYIGNMYIDNSVNFNISSTSDSASTYGVYFNTIALGSTQTINGTFAITAARGVYGVRFYSTASNSTQTINGTFTINSSSSTLTDAAYGVWFYSTAAGSITINATFTITAEKRDAYGVYFNSTASGSTQTINGTFAIVTARYAYGVNFHATAAGSTTVDGTFTVSSTGNNNSACGVQLNNTTAAGSITINGTFTIFASGSGGMAYGVRFNSTDSGSTQTINGMFTITGNGDAAGVSFINNANGTLTKTTASFFSNKVDSGNIFGSGGKYASWEGSYNWNGIKIDKNHAFAATDGDGDLSLQTINDTGTGAYNFWINVISACGQSGTFVNSKKTFNTEYKTALRAYVDGPDCPTTAKGWLEKIIDNIPIPT